ncbi:MAG: hypothetical protein OEW58_03985, partial [Gammaproteobacteria bacterium]|nr:hypothetical protein [Gammaproteobacteria bacterium]
RTRVAEISTMGRNAQGVRLINLVDGEKLVGLDRICEVDINGEGEDDVAAETPEA